MLHRTVEIAAQSGPSPAYHANGRFRVVTSIGRRNTLSKHAEDGGYADESMELTRFHGGRESRVVGPLAPRQEIYAKLLRFGFLERFIHQSTMKIGFAVCVTTVLLEILAVRTHPKMMFALLLRYLMQHAF